MVTNRRREEAKNRRRYIKWIFMAEGMKKIDGSMKTVGF
jgi:hypothetical protein